LGLMDGEWAARETTRAREVHLINPLGNPAGGSEWRTVSLYEALVGHCRVTLWSPTAPHSRFSGFPVKRIQPHRFRFPRGGVLVFVGVYFHLGLWVYLTRPQRTLLVYNTFSPKMIGPRVRRLSYLGLRRVELVFPSLWLREASGLPGVVENPLIDTARFSPERGERDPSRRGQFTVGRMSRDTRIKHHPDDPRLYLQIAAHDCRVRIMGGTCLADQLGGAPNVALLPACAEEPEVFLRGLDCFYYRTSQEWPEAAARVVGEAMACGLPVVCHNRGGHTEWIRHGVNGFLFDSDDRALALTLRLKEDPGLRDLIGREARRTAQALFSRESREAVVGFYLR
jgi:glycosyltransferase involved in cell wall biosynthesis